MIWDILEDGLALVSLGLFLASLIVWFAILTA